MGGEKGCGPLSRCPQQGSPPRGRGKGPRLEKTAVPGGITPAWAGKSLTIPKLTTRSWDHPRVGGEKGAPALRAPCLRGSPPRGRGKGLSMSRHCRPPRITPAWAGKRFFFGFCVGTVWDHPRVGGEKAKLKAMQTNVIGSPPRGRGKANHACLSTCSSGITPAWAGKRSHYKHKDMIY